MSTAERRYTSVELFAGAGGLALGIAQAGFEHLAIVEWNSDACASLRYNADRIPLMRDWPIHEVDAREFDYAPYADRVTLLSAGAPCQPFSLGGKHRGDRDERNLFPEVFRAVREMRPDIVVVENVRGLLRKSFRPYFEYILLQLRYADATLRSGETWREHKERLARLDADGDHDSDGLRYNVTHQLLNAADFGLPQRRERVFIVAFRHDLGIEWEPVTATHSGDALLYAQWVDGSYWEEHGMKPLEMPRRVRRRVEQLSLFGPPPERRWRTVRDALMDLPEPINGVEHPRIPNHVGNPGAKIYPGHTGSPLDQPAKTIKAGDHGVPGGENMLRRPDGSVRYFTVRETARLQGFPDEYVLRGSWTEAMRQLGNAVPVDLARVVAERARRVLEESERRALVA